MAAPEASCSSRNQTVEGPVLSGSAGAIHESHESASNASNVPPAASLTSVMVHLGYASNAFKNNSPLSKNASSTSVMHSSWIQRLKPSGQSCTPKDEPPALSKRENFVCTHFTKDYSSCSRRLDKLPHHTRSSSWPPHGDLSVVMQLPMEVGEPVYRIAREHENTAASYPNLDHQIISVPSKNATESSEAGSRTGSQQDCQKRVHTLEGFVPCAQLNALNKHTSSLGRSKNLQDSEDRDHRRPDNYCGQQFKNFTKDENKADFVTVSEQAQGQSQEVHKNCSYIGGSFPSFRELINAPGLLVSVRGAGHSSGASADADADPSIGNAKALNYGAVDEKEVHQTRFGESECKANYRAAVISRNKGKIDQFGLILPSHKRAVHDGFSLGLKVAGDRCLPQAKQNFNLFKGAAKKAYLRNGFGTESPNNLHISHSNFQRAGACTRDAMTAYGNDPHRIGNFAFKSQNIVSSGMDAPCLRMATSQNPHYSEEGQASRSPVSIKSVHEDAARARIREKSLGDYWNSWARVLKEPGHGRPLNMGHSEESLHQEFAIEPFGQQPSSTKQNFLNVNSCKSQKLLSSVKDIGSGHSGQQSLPFMEHDKYSNRRIKSKQLIASSDHFSNFRVDCLEVPQDHYLYPYEGASGRVDSQPRDENSGFCRSFRDDGSSHSRMHSIHPDKERSRKEQNLQSGWLQRWRCAENISSGSRKPSTFVGDNSRSVSSNQLAKELPKSWSASPQCTLGSSHKNMCPFEGNLTESGRGSNRYTEASGTRLDSGSASTPASRPAGQNFAAFRSGYSRASIEAMAIVGNSACKLHPTSLENGGFYRLPCARAKKTFECLFLLEDDNDADENEMHFVDLTDWEQGDIGGS